MLRMCMVCTLESHAALDLYKLHMHAHFSLYFASQGKNITLHERQPIVESEGEEDPA